MLPGSLIKFNCEDNQIKSFAELTLPSSLINFNCSFNKITSFSELTLPVSLKKFDCSFNKIKSFVGLKLPDSLRKFDCFNNKITSSYNFIFPPGLTKLVISDKVEFINPRFNSVLHDKLSNKVIYDELGHEHLIFVYLNFELTHHQYDEILNLLEIMK